MIRCQLKENYGHHISRHIGAMFPQFSISSHHVGHSRQNLSEISYKKSLILQYNAWISYIISIIHVSYFTDMYTTTSSKAFNKSCEK